MGGAEMEMLMRFAGVTQWFGLFDWLAERLGVPGAIVAVLLLGLAYLIVRGWLRAPSRQDTAPQMEEDEHKEDRGDQ